MARYETDLKFNDSPIKCFILSLVLAFTGAPGSFPIAKENVPLQKYLKWNMKVLSKAKNEIAKLPNGPFIAVHLRNGIDWVKYSMKLY